MAYGGRFSIERMNKAELLYNVIIFHVMNCLVSVSLYYPYAEIHPRDVPCI